MPSATVVQRRGQPTSETEVGEPQASAPAPIKRLGEDSLRALLAAPLKSAPPADPSLPPIRSRLPRFQPKPLPPDLAAVLDFARNPKAKAAQERPLPHGIGRLLRIAAGSTQALQNAVRITGKDPTYLRAAIVFYLEQVLWKGTPDPYRVLGAAQDTSREELVANVRCLMSWLHRYLGGSEPEADFADQVCAAWNAVKNVQPTVPAEQSATRGTAAAKARSSFSAPGHLSALAVTAQLLMRRRWPLAAAAVAGVVTIVGFALSAGQSEDLSESRRMGSAENAGIASGITPVASADVR